MDRWIQGRKTKRSVSGWVSGNSVCCIHNGESEDRRMRGGLVFADNGFVYSCFNCGFKVKYTPGSALSLKVKKLLEWLGVDKNDIAHLNLESLKQKSILNILETKKMIGRWSPYFETRNLPEGLEIIDSNNPCHQRYIDYLRNRGVDSTRYPYMVDPSAPSRNKNRIVIPYTYENTIVGYTARYMDDRNPKYFGEVQSGYVFGTDIQKSDWLFAIVVEGVFDAISIGGLALIHNDINDKQADMIRSLEKKVIVVPDQDKAGISVINKAVENGWSVSIPEWQSGCKDVNDAVIRYGKLATIMSIVESAESSKIKIEMSKKRLLKQISNK